MTYVTFSLEMDVDEALERVFEVMTNQDMNDLVDDLVRGGFGRSPGVRTSDPDPLDLDDPAYRLEVITWLRNNGYRVEGGGPL